MTLTWKDLTTTILAGIVFLLYLSSTATIKLPFELSTRVIVIVLGLVGLAMCIFSGYTPTPEKSWLTILFGGMGVLAFGLIIAGLTTANKMVLTALVIDILALWLLTTLKHAFSL